MTTLAQGMISIASVMEGYTALLSNDSVSIATDKDGNNPVLNGAFTTASLALGATAVTAYIPTAPASFTRSGCTVTVSGTTVTLATVTADTGYVDIPVYSNSARTPEYLVVTKRFSFSKSKQGNTGAQGPQGLQGLQGDQGDQGIKGSPGVNGVSSYTHIAYSTSPTGATGFSTSNPSGATYIGMYVDTLATDSDSPSKYKWTLIKGADGTQGIQGPTGSDGKTSYLHIAYATNSTGTSGFDTVVSTGKTYIGQYTDFLSADSTNPALYSWTLIKGDKGDKGDAGPQGLQGLQGTKGDQGIKGGPGANGLSSYTHIAYATGTTGQGFSVSHFASATYIGVYVDNVSTDSESYTKYKWSLIKGADGTQGIPGPKGTDGLTPYFHTAWANSADGVSGFSTTVSIGKLYIGVYTDFKSEDETSPSKYKWTLIKGETGAKGDTGTKGISITKVDVMYYLSTSSTVLTGGSWSTLAPDWIDGRFMWSKTVTTYSSGNPTESKPACITGQKGSTGSPGKGITSAVVTYQNHTNGSAAPTGTWSATVPTLVKGQYLWTRTITTYTDASSIPTYSVAYNATDGQNGTNGKGISSTVVSYQLSTSGTATPTGTWVASPPTPVKGQYLWARTVINYTTGSPSTSYSTSYYATDGQKGAKGDTGASGADAITILLSNESHTFAGNISNALAGSTVVNIIAYKGATRVVSSIGTITGQVTGLTASITGNGTTSNAFTVSATTALKTANGVLTIPITVDGKVFTKSFSFAVSFKGATGTPGSPGASGANAKVITLTASAQIFTKPKTGAVAPSTITVAGTTQNITIATWQYSTNGGAFTTTLPTGVTRSGNVVTINGTTMNVKTIAVKAFNGAVEDTVTIAKVEDGVDGATGKGVTSITEEYAISTSKATAPADASFSTTRPTWTAGSYIWTRSKIVYNNPTSTAYTAKVVSSEWEAINEIEVGGKNLIVLSKLYSHTAYNTAPTITNGVISTVGAGTAYALTLARGGWTPENIQYTLSGIMKKNGAPVTNAMWTLKRASTYSASTQYFYIDDATGKFVITETYSGSSAWIFHALITFKVGDVITLENFKMEKGNKATDWTPAPEDVDSAIENIQVGGRNLLTGSDFEEPTPDGFTVNANVAISLSTDFYYNGSKSFKIVYTGPNGAVRKEITGDCLNMCKGKEVSFSFKIRGNGSSIGKNIVATILNSDSTKKDSEFLTLTANWQTMYVTTTIPANATYFRLYIGFGSLVSGDAVYVDCAKLELGNKITDWSPAPEDVDSKIAAAQATANGKNVVFYQTAAPPTTGRVVGDTWFDSDDGNSIYKWSGSAWTRAQFGTNAIASLDAGKITTGYIQAARVAAGSLTADKIKGGTLALGGSGANTNGVLSINNSAGTEIVRGDNQGLLVNGGNYRIKDEFGNICNALSSSNLITNGGFELFFNGNLDSDGHHLSAKVEGWTPQGTMRIANTGSESGLPQTCRYDGETSATMTSAGSFSQPFSAFTGTTYTVSFCARLNPVKSSGVSSGGVRVRALKGSASGVKETVGTASYSKTFAVSQAWSRHSYTFVASNLPNNLRLDFLELHLTSTTAAWVMIDCVQVVEGSLPCLIDTASPGNRIAPERIGNGDLFINGAMRINNFHVVTGSAPWRIHATFVNVVNGAWTLVDYSSSNFTQGIRIFTTARQGINSQALVNNDTLTSCYVAFPGGVSGYIFVLAVGY